MRMTQNEMILKYLQEGHSLTALEALEKFGCFRLASRINDIKNLLDQGCTGLIQSEMVKGENGKHYKRYWIAKEAKQLSFI